MKRLKYQILSQWVVLLSLISALMSCQQSHITFSKDIAPIIHKNCTPCHNSNGGAPFNLIQYHEVKKRAKMIAHVTKTRYMPPWPADVHYSRFVNERFLSDEEINIIEKWFKTGAKPGDTSNIKPPVFNASILGKPDLIIDVPSVLIKNNNKDQFYSIKIPYQIPKNQYVKAIEFIPGQKKIVHHFNGHYLSFNEQTNPFVGHRIANLESPNYLEEFSQLQLFNQDGSTSNRVHSAVNYLPGSFGIQYPNGIGGFVLTKNGAFVANDIHYGPSRKSVWDSSKLFLYFTNQAPTRPTFELMLGTNGISKINPPLIIPPNQITKHTTQVSVYNDITVLTINPHMHLIGKSFKAYAVKPSGDTIPLIHIPKWQFRWQYFYTFKTAVKINKGSVIVVEAEFDNTTKNPNNPNKIPLEIRERLDFGGASMRTTDEMLQFIITYMPYQKGDENLKLE